MRKGEGGCGRAGGLEVVVCVLAGPVGNRGTRLSCDRVIGFSKWPFPLCGRVSFGSVLAGKRMPEHIFGWSCTPSRMCTGIYWQCTIDQRYMSEVLQLWQCGDRPMCMHLLNQQKMFSAYLHQ